MHRWLTALVVGLALTNASTLHAQVTYEFIPTGEASGIATITFTTPPASATSGWTAVQANQILSIT